MRPLKIIETVIMSKNSLYIYPYGKYLCTHMLIKCTSSNLVQLRHCSPTRARCGDGNSAHGRTKGAQIYVPAAAVVWAVASLARGQRHSAPAPHGGRIPPIEGNDDARALACMTGGCAFGMVAALGAAHTVVAGLIDLPCAPTLQRLDNSILRGWQRRSTLQGRCVWLFQATSEL